MNKHPRRWTAIAPLLLLAILTVPAMGSVYIFPNFGEPMTSGGVIVFTSPDSKSIVAIDRNGTPVWTKKFRKPVFLQRRDASSALIQQGRVVSVLDLATGTTERVLRLPAHEILSVGVRRNVVLGFDDRFSVRHARYRDPQRLEVHWESDLMEDLVATSPELIVVKSGRREYENLVWSKTSFQLRDLKVLALERSTGAIRWSIPLGDSDEGVRGELVGPYLVLGTGFWNGSLQVIDARDGTVVRRKALNRGAGDMDQVNGMLVLLDKGEGLDENVVRTLTVPELDDHASVTIHSRESLVMMQTAPRLVTHGFYSAAAFDPATGIRLWEKERQMFFEPPEGDTIVAAVVEERNARAAIVEIRIADGVERTLHSEAVTAPAEPRQRVSQRIEEWMYAAEEAIASKLRRVRERRRRLPVGEELCFQHLNSGVSGMEDFLILERDGSYTHTVSQDGVAWSSDRGSWERRGNLYALRAADEMREVSAGRLSISVGHRERVALLEELNMSLEALLAMGSDEFSREDLERAAVLLPECPPERSEHCTVAGLEHMGVMLWPLEDFDVENPWAPASRFDVEDLRAEIQRYLRSSDQNLFQFELRTYRSERYPLWCDKQLLWPDDDAFVQREIDSSLDFDSPARTQLLAGCNAVRARLRVILATRPQE